MKIVRPEHTINGIVEQLKDNAAEKRDRLSKMWQPDIGASEAGSSNGASRLEIEPLHLYPEPQDRNLSKYKLNDLLAYDDAEFVYNAYRAILKRAPDPQGLDNALTDLRNARSDKIDILAELRYSGEGIAKGVRIPTLGLHAFFRRISSVPIVGRIADTLRHVLRLPHTAREQQRLAGQLFLRQETIADYINQSIAPNLRHGLQAIDQGFQEQRKTQEAIFEKVAELTKFFEDRVNEEALRREQQAAYRSEEIGDLRLVYNKYRTQVELVEKDLKREMERLFRKQQEVATELVLQVRRLSARPKSADSVDETPGLVSSYSSTLDAFFASFDEHFRGDQRLVRQRLQEYLKDVKAQGAGTEGAAILDVACGRGEWLNLLREEGLHATGVDSNSILVSQCRDAGLDVVEADLIRHLESLADGSLGVVSGFHIAEHLSIEDLVTFINEVVRVLKPGGLLLLETPNPQNVLVGSCNFYFDPTHRNPLPKSVLKFIVESRGLIVSEVRDLNPSDEKPVAGESELTERFNQYFYGPMDYAIVARKVG